MFIVTKDKLQGINHIFGKLLFPHQIQNGIYMPIVFDNDRFGVFHTFTLEVQSMPNQFEVSKQYFELFGAKEHEVLLSPAFDGAKERMNARYFMKEKQPFQNRDDIFVKSSAIGKYYELGVYGEVSKSYGDIISIRLEDVIGYRKWKEKSIYPMKGVMFGSPHTIESKGILGAIAPITGLFKVSHSSEKGIEVGDVLKGWSKNYAFFYIRSREGVQQMKHYHYTSFFHSIWKRGEFRPLPGWHYLEFDREKTQLMISEGKPLLSGTLVAGAKTGQRVVYNLLYAPFEWKGKLVCAIKDENIIAIL